MMRKPITIFIVEDELLIVSCLKDQLITAGYKVLGTATRGEASIQAIRELKRDGVEPEVILMDIHLRGAMDGVETARLISEEFHCAIIFLTGQSSREVYNRSFNIKPFGYILKPYDSDQMIMTIEIAAYQRKLETENQEIRKELERHLKQQIRENSEMMELYQTIMENTPAGIRILQDDQVIFANQAVAAMFGYDLDAIQGFTERDLLGLVHPADQHRVLELTHHRLEGTSSPPHAVFRIFRKDGEIRWIKSFFKRIMYRGTPALHQTYFDITEYIDFNPNQSVDPHEKS